MRKRVFGHMRTTKAQINMRNRAFWTVPSLFANIIIGYYRVTIWMKNKGPDNTLRMRWMILMRILHLFGVTFSLDTAQSHTSMSAQSHTSLLKVTVKNTLCTHAIWSWPPLLIDRFYDTRLRMPLLEIVQSGQDLWHFAYSRRSFS